MSKRDWNQSLLEQVAAYAAAGPDELSRMANISALLYKEFAWHWVGFYRVVDGELVLGPFQGPAACSRIAFGKGVCGTAWKEKKTLIVPDVDAFPGHIACSALSRSEIVVPVIDRGSVTAVLDIDSVQKDEFDERDREFLERIASEARPVRSSLERYITQEIIPRYDHFDQGHDRRHVLRVIDDALALSARYRINPEIVYCAAACHDLGLAEDRKTHHLVSGRIIREDTNLRNWFSAKQIETIAQATEDHRASLDREPRDIYGKIIAEADRQIDVQTVVRRTVQFGLDHEPGLDREGQWQRCHAPRMEKYAEGGYLRLWIPESPNAARLEELRELIRDSARLRALFDRYYDQFA